MHNRFYLSLFLLAIFSFFSYTARAQEEPEEGEGEIEDVQVEIVKDREIELPPAVRKFDKVPPQQETQTKPDITYSYGIPRMNLSPLDLRLRPLRIKDEPLTKTYGNYLAAGFGNYLTPYLEGFVNSKREKNMSYGAHGKYLSSFRGPVDDENSANGMFEVDVFGSYYGKKATLSGDLGFRRRNLYYYGYPEGTEVDRDTVKQHFNHIFAEGILASSESNSSYDYQVKLKVDNLSDNYELSETTAAFDWKNAYNFTDEAAIILNTSYTFIRFGTEDIEGINRHLFKVQPRVKLNISGINLKAGLNAAYENDSIGDSEDLHIYPYAYASFDFSENFQLFAELGGDIEQVSFRQLSYENPFLGRQNLAFHSNKTFDLSGGIKGRLGQKVGLMGGFSVQNYKNLFFFIPSDQDPALDFYDNQPVRTYWHSVIYDKGNTSIFSLYGQMSVNASEDLYVNFNARYNSYSTDEIAEAYHRPEWRIGSEIFYSLYDKINFTMNFYGLGGIAAIDETGDDITLDPALDLNIRADYLLSDRASIFVQFNNIISQEYQLLYRYPVRGFQVMGGVTLNF